MEYTDRKAYLTSQEAAEILRVTPATVMNMIKRGQLRGKKIGVGGVSSPWRIPQEDVLEYAGLKEEEPSAQASI